MSETNPLPADRQGSDRLEPDQLLALIYDELRKLAASKLAREQQGQTLQATALVHEVYLRVMANKPIQNWNGPGHLFAAAAEAMRRILVEQARRRAREKHGGDWRRIELPAELSDREAPDEELLALDQALARLEQEDPLAANVTKLKYFAGLGRESIANALGISVHETRQKWAYARAWLRVAMSCDE